MRIDIDSIDVPNLAVYRHFLVFDHLFGENVFFDNVQNLEVSFGDDAVHSGNILTASTTSSRPDVKIESVGKGGFNTLIMVNIDGNALQDKKGEVVQWLVSNIPDGANVSAGKEVVEYLQPLPFYGTGYNRVAFVLFRHSAPIDLDLNGISLENRIQEIAQLYKANENVMTPSAIRFFQTTYDNSVKATLHSLGNFFKGFLTLDSFYRIEISTL